MKRLLAFSLLLMLCGLSFSQEVKFEAYAPNLVSIGEQFRLTYSITKQPTSCSLPDIKGFEILAGPSTSHSTSVEVVNGKVSQSEIITYTYILEASKEGKYTIDAATAVVSNGEVKSNPITIEVVKQTNGSQQQQGQNPNQQEQTESSGALPNSELFVTVEANRRSVYLGEPIVATLKLYTRVNIAGFEDAKLPSFNGFWSQEIETPSSFSYQRENVNGVIYSTAIIKKFLLFPQKNSTLEIDPFEWVVVYQLRSNRSQSLFDDFFGSVENYRKRLISKPISISIKDLPINAPESFKGGVGTFKIEPTLDKKKVKTNEAVTLKVKVFGTGNIKLVESPKIEFPSSFEVFDPKTTDKIANTSQGASGYKVFEYVAIPRTPGDFTIPPVEFTYFDPVKGQYITLKSTEFEVKVTSDGADSGNVSNFGYGKEDIKFIGKDIRFIKTKKIGEQPFSGYFMGSGLFYFIIILLLTSFGALMYWMSKHQKEMSNITLIRNKKANKVARRRLLVAESHLKVNNRELFFEEIHKAMWGYLSDKLSIPLSNLTSDNARLELKAKEIDDVDIEEFMRIISVCEFARFAPANDTSEMNLLYDSAHLLISKLEQIIKK
jgi:hypothetical protein